MAPAIVETHPSLPSRPIHPSIRVEAVTTPDGKYLVTGAEDGQVKSVNLDSGEDSLLLDLEDEVTAVALSPEGEQLLVATNNYELNAYKFPNPGGATRELIYRSTLPIRHIAYGKHHIAVVGDNPGVHLFLQSNPEEGHEVLKGHDGAVYSVCFDPLGEFLTSAGQDGKVCLWDVSKKKEKGEREQKAMFLGVEDKSDRFEEGMLFRLAWSHDGKFLALSGKKDVEVRGRKSLAVAYTLKGGHAKAVTALQWSPNGLYLASVGLDKQLIVWDTTTRDKVCSYSHDTLFSGLLWQPNSNSCVTVDFEGNYSALRHLIPAAMASPLLSRSEKEANRKALSSHLPEQSKPDSGSSTYRGPAGENADSQHKSKKKSMIEDDEEEEEEVGGGKGENRAHGSQGPEETREGEEELDSVKAIKASLGFNEDASLAEDDRHLLPEDGEDGAEAGADGAAASASVRRELGRVSALASRALHASDRVRRCLSLQAPFQPGATDEKKHRRLLVWNAVGVIESLRQDHGADDDEDGAGGSGSHQRSVKIEFSDKSQTKPARFMDHYGFSMAALSEEAAFFACRASSSDDDAPGAAGEKRSTLYYRPSRSWTHRGDWSHTLPEGEEAEAVAVGDGWAAVVTSRRFLRVFQASGLEDSIVHLPGAPITLVGSGPLLAVVSHQAFPLEDTPNLSFSLFHVCPGSLRELSSGSLPLSAQSQLVWLGFSDTLTLVAADSAGLVSGLVKRGSWQWWPLLDTGLLRRSSMHRHWFIGVTRGHVTCVDLYSGLADPPINPRPVISAIPLQIPLVEGWTSRDNPAQKILQSSLELSALESMVALDNEEAEREKEEAIISETDSLDRLLLKEMQSACKKDNPGRALDLALRLRKTKSVAVAIKVATHAQLHALVERLEDLYQVKLSEGSGGMEALPPAPTVTRSFRTESSSRRSFEEIQKSANSALKSHYKSQESQQQRRNRLSKAHHHTESDDESQSDGEEDSAVSTTARAAAVSTPPRLVVKRRRPADGSGDVVSSQNGKDTEKQGAKENLRGEENQLLDSEKSKKDSAHKQQEESSEPVEIKVPVNPFQKAVAASPVKRQKTAIETLTSLHKSPLSPSPMKKNVIKPSLNRDSSFSIEARTKKRHDRR